MENTSEKPVIYIVMPCYNEQEVLPITAEIARKKLQVLVTEKKISAKSKIVFINDGSKDGTWKIISKLHAKNKEIFRGINLSRNRGHQNALLAGLLTVKDEADAVVSMDADLQDDINAIDEMIQKYKHGYDIVYGVRNARRKDTWFKRVTAKSYYRILSKLGGDIIENHADFRLMSKRALEGLEQFNEVNLFLRGLVPMIGYKSTVVKYARDVRAAGESKYPLKKMLFFAFEGVTSLSIAPIRIVGGLGMCTLLVGLVILIYALGEYFAGNTVPGWTSVLISLWMIGGIMLISLGIVGQYVGKMYLETKRRPRYIVEEYLR